jgi:hypothetical protein
MKPIKSSITLSIDRSQINFAPYNPREDDPALVKELMQNFQRVGFLGGIVWNSATGNLVGGHKRVMAHDVYYKYDGANDYKIKVEVIELDEKTEKEQNLFLNKKQGKFDKIRLFDLLQEIEPVNAGYSQDEMRMIEAMIPTVTDNFNTEPIAPPELNQVLDMSAIDKVKQAKKDQANASFMKQVEMNNSLIVKFTSAEEKAYFCESIGVDFNLTTISGNMLFDKIDK